MSPVGGGNAHAVAIDRHDGAGRGARGLGLGHGVHDDDLVADDQPHDTDRVAEPMAEVEGAHGCAPSRMPAGAGRTGVPGGRTGGTRDVHRLAAARSTAFPAAIAAAIAGKVASAAS